MKTAHIAPLLVATHLYAALLGSLYGVNDGMNTCDRECIRMFCALIPDLAECRRIRQR